MSRCGSALLTVLFLTVVIQAQTTLFSHEGNLPKNVTPATGTFEFEVRLLDAFTGGTQIGSTNVIDAVEVKNLG